MRSVEQALQSVSFRTLKDFKQIRRLECVDNRSSCKEVEGKYENKEGKNTKCEQVKSGMCRRIRGGGGCNAM